VGLGTLHPTKGTRIQSRPSETNSIAFGSFSERSELKPPIRVGIGGAYEQKHTVSVAPALPTWSWQERWHRDCTRSGILSHRWFTLRRQIAKEQDLTASCRLEW